MHHPDLKTARRLADPMKCSEATKIVYSGKSERDRSSLFAEMRECASEYEVSPPSLNVYFGELHGHSCLSDGKPTIDEYFLHLRDTAEVDFAALTDHDHGGLGGDELWGGENKWELIKAKTKEYYEPHKFTTLLAYERDSFPFYNNMIVYYNNHDGELVRGETDGMIRQSELKALLEREDVFIVPHDTWNLSSGTDLIHLPSELLPNHIELCSRGDAVEYMSSPVFAQSEACEGGFWQDALKRGKTIFCVGGSDDHNCKNATVVNELGYPSMYPGMTGVWAKENTLPSIYDALKNGRCYTFMRGDQNSAMKGYVTLDFRINGRYMGETIEREDDSITIFYEVKADVNVKRVTLVKNCRDVIFTSSPRRTLLDLNQETECDSFYIRAELSDGRYAWSSPIWVRSKENI